MPCFMVVDFLITHTHIMSVCINMYYVGSLGLMMFSLVTTVTSYFALVFYLV